jgi:lipopolysaccharide transport system permease protein
MFITLLMLGVVFSSVFKIQIYHYLPYVYCGLLSWGFISSVINDSTQIYLSGNMKYFNFNIYYLQLKVVFKQIIIFLHNLSIYLLILIFLNNEIFNFNYFLLIVPGLMIFFLCSISLVGILAPLCAKYLDFGFMVSNFVYILFLVSPVFWDPRYFKW